MKNFQIKSAFAAFLFLFAFTFSACDNDDDDVVALPAAVEPSLIITSPSEHQMVISGQTVNITGTIKAEKTLHGYTIFIRNKADNSEVFKKDVHEHKTEITINEPWTVSAVTGHTDLELEIISALDHDGNTISKKVNFHAMP